MKAKYAIKWIESTDSTNSEVARNIEEYDNLSVVATIEQSAGRGQRGNVWESTPGDNLTFSMAFKPEDFPAGEQFLISQATALAVCDYLTGKGIDSMVKWPNDIYVMDRKICGILIENKIRDGRLWCSIIGIGLNFNQTKWSPAVPNPTSVALESRLDAPADITKELPELVQALVQRLAQTRTGAQKLKDEYLEKLYRRAQEHLFSEPLTSRVFTGTITGVTDKGTLLVRDKEGSEKEYAFKEIAYIL